MPKRKYTSLSVPVELYRAQKQIIDAIGINLSALYKLAFINFIRTGNYEIQSQYLKKNEQKAAYKITQYFMDEEQEKELNEIRETNTELKVLTPIKLQAIHNYCIKMLEEIGLKCDLER